jgi:hypothetical protein
MGLNNFVNVLLVHERVPNSLWVHHRNRSRRASVHATGFVHAHLARPGNPGRFHRSFAVVKRGLGLVLRTALLPIAALVQTKKYVSLKVRARFR